MILLEKTMLWNKHNQIYIMETNILTVENLCPNHRWQWQTLIALAHANITSLSLEITRHRSFVSWLGRSFIVVVNYFLLYSYSLIDVPMLTSEATIAVDGGGACLPKYCSIVIPRVWLPEHTCVYKIDDMKHFQWWTPQWRSRCPTRLYS